jgi:hypothetical protein
MAPAGPGDPAGTLSVTDANSELPAQCRSGRDGQSCGWASQVHISAGPGGLIVRRWSGSGYVTGPLDEWDVHRYRYM